MASFQVSLIFWYICILFLHNNSFLEEAIFRKIFYRIIDTLGEDDDDREKMLDIESQTYGAIIDELESEKNVDQRNKLADRRIAKAIMTSFRVYETSRNKFDRSYFNFK